jgi:class 3 adenylate cyclase
MESSSRTLVCSVLFLDIVEYSKKAVADQLHLKQAFNQVLAKALEEVAPRDRIILDTGDGAAVTFMGDPEDALFAAVSVRDMAAAFAEGRGPLPVRLGVNLGPVRLVKDLNGQMNIIGDGINVAQRVMSFARPGQLLVSRSFYEVVSCLSRDYLSLFRHEGSRTDKHVREHEVYSVGGAPAARRVAEVESLVVGRGLTAWLAGTGPLGIRRSALAAAPAVFTAFLGAGVTVSAVSTDSGAEPLPTVASARAPVAAVERPVLVNASDLARRAAVEPETKIVAAPAAQKPSIPSPPSETPIAKPAPTKPQPARDASQVIVSSAPAVSAPAAAERPGRLVVAIAPWGEIFVDGTSRGVSPPVQMVELSPGPHTVEIRNGAFPARVERIVVKPGEPVRIRHRFQ